MHWNLPNVIGITIIFSKWLLTLGALYPIVPSAINNCSITLHYTDMLYLDQYVAGWRNNCILCGINLSIKVHKGPYSYWAPFSIAFLSGISMGHLIINQFTLHILVHVSKLFSILTCLSECQSHQINALIQMRKMIHSGTSFVWWELLSRLFTTVLNL